MCIRVATWKACPPCKSKHSAQCGEANSERRNYQNGILQLEKRAYRRKKDRKLTQRGPYWYFHFREGGRQRTLYFGKTDNPETVVGEKLSEKPTKGTSHG
jgi:hypothetical protein